MKKVLFRWENLLYLVMFILLIFVHLPLLTKNILTADVILNNSFYNGYSWEISLGRFGLFFIGLLKGYVSNKILEIIISSILIVTITFLLIKLFDIKDKFGKACSIILMILSPIISSTLLFHYCSVPYFLAFLFSILSLYIYYNVKNKIIKYLIPICLIIISLSFYQAYFSVMVTVFFLYQIKLILDKKINYKNSFIYLLLLFISLIIYFICVKISLFVFHIDMASYSNASSIGLSTLLQIPNKIIDSYVLFYKMYFTNEFTKNTYLFNNIIYYFLFIIFIINYVYTLIKSKINNKEKILLVVLLLLIPVFLNSIIFIIPDSKLQLLMSASYLVFMIFTFNFINIKYSKVLFYIFLIILFRNYFIQVEASYITLEDTYNTYKTIIGNGIKDKEKTYIIVGNIGNTNTSITNNNYGYISDEGLFWDEYNLRKLGVERFCKQTYGYDIKFGDEDNYNYLVKDNNKQIIYEYNDNIVLNLNNY